MMGWFPRVFWTLAAGGLVYVIGICTLTIPTVQRNATYANRVNPTLWQNLSNVEQFGFIRHQVQAFTVTVNENVTLYAWHVLPIHLYHQHLGALSSQKDFGVLPFEQAANTVGMQLMLKDPSAHVVVSFHGNAAHLASAQRPQTYQQFLGASTPDHPVHVIAFDYRGFGLSTGSPTEEGVIEDGVALISKLCGKPNPSLQLEGDEYSSSLPTKALQPSQIILAGQSLGTFVSTATLHDWVMRLQHPPFKALILFASFTTLPQLLNSYSIKGFTPPLLSPLISYPWLQRWFMRKIVDKWETAPRLQELVRESDIPLDITIMHARNDWEIPWYEGMGNWNAVLEATDGQGSLSIGTEANGSNENINVWTSTNGNKRVKWERIDHGGHNKIPASEQAKLALWEALQR